MGSHVTSIIETGLSCVGIDIECHVSQGLPNVVIIGSVNRSLEEARERLRGAFASSRLEWPRQRVTINLAPGDIPKDGTGFDLAIATAVLQASQEYPRPFAHDSVFIGELSLDGASRPVRGLIGKLLAARDLGLQNFFIPTANLEQAKLVPKIRIFPVKRLRDIHEHLLGFSPIPPVLSGNPTLPTDEHPFSDDISAVVGQPQAKRALMIAAAGGHNLLLIGPPGAGKSMLARCLPSLLPPLSADEALAVTHVHSLISPRFDQIISRRPFRSPHHSSSLSALIGNTAPVRPGEISLAHQGVLLLDELPEFHRDVIEALRQPLEDQSITILRQHQRVTFPAQFLLVATANPCACGYHGTDDDHGVSRCTCPPYNVLRYQQKLSGPIVDRIDLTVRVGAIDTKKLLRKTASAASQQIQQRVIAARQRQQSRYHTPLLNSQLSNAAIKEHAHLTPEAKKLLNSAAGRYHLSARAYMRSLKVARTIADLENSPSIKSEHITEAFQYRRQD